MMCAGARVRVAGARRLLTLTAAARAPCRPVRVAEITIRAEGLRFPLPTVPLRRCAGTLVSR